MNAYEILIDHLEMSLDGENTDDETRSDVLDAIHAMESTEPTFEKGGWGVIQIHDFVHYCFGIDLDLNDVELFGKLLKAFNE